MLQLLAHCSFCLRAQVEVGAERSVDIHALRWRGDAGGGGFPNGLPVVWDVIRRITSETAGGVEPIGGVVSSG
jgi:hypothetical protein